MRWFGKQKKDDITTADGLVHMICVFAGTCADDVISHLECPAGLNPADVRSFVLCEYLFFFIHMVSREAVDALGEGSDRFMEAVVESLTTACGDVVVDELNTREPAYAACKHFFCEGKLTSGDGLFNTLSRRIAEGLGNVYNPLTVRKIQFIATSAWKCMDLPSRVRAVAREM